MECAHCKKPINAQSAWKGAGDRFYCAEFCADAEPIAFTSVPDRMRQYSRERRERFERLLPYIGRSVHPRSEYRMNSGL